MCAQCSAGPCRDRADGSEAWPCAASDEGSGSSVSPPALRTPSCERAAACSVLSPLSSFLGPVSAVVFLLVFGQSRVGLLKRFSFVRPLFS